MKLFAVLLLSLQVITTAPRQVIIVAGPAKPLPQVLIPNDRLTLWTPNVYAGVPGGPITPSPGTECAHATCVALRDAASGYKDGTLDATSLIQNAIINANAGTYVYMECGTYRVASALNWAHTDDSVTLRGCTTGTTTIRADFTGSYLLHVGSQADSNFTSPASNNTVTGYSGDCATLTMASTASFTANLIVRFSVSNDPLIPVLSTHGYPMLRKQMTKVVSKTDTTLKVFPPIYGCLRFSALTAKVHITTQQADLVGIENITFDGNDTVDSGLILAQTNGAWLKNVRVTNFNNFLVTILNSLHCEVRHSTIEEGGTGGNNGTGLMMIGTSGCLIEDNILREVQPVLTVKDGASGNVIAYNFMHNANGTITADTNHGGHNSFNLYEGNITTNLISDGYYGSESVVTFFRNYAHGNGETGFGTLASYCFALKRFTRNASAVGNIFGGSLWNADCFKYGDPNIGNTSSSGTAQTSQGDYWVDWNLSGTTIAGTLTTRTNDTAGQITLSAGTLTTDNDQIAIWTAASTTNPCCIANVSGVAGNVVTFTNSGVLPALSTAVTIWRGPEGFQERDLDVQATLVSKGNWDVRTGSIIGGSPTLPPSLFRTSKPLWFLDRAWPPIDPYSPSASLESIPAGYRFVHGTDPPSSGVGTFTMDMVVNFSSGTPGQLLTATAMNAGTHTTIGGGPWHELHGGVTDAPNTHTYIEDHDIVFPGTIMVGGTPYNGSEGQGMSFDVSDFDGEPVNDVYQWLTTGQGILNAQVLYLVDYGAIWKAGTYNTDTFSLTGGQFSVGQFRSNFTSARQIYAHASGDLGKIINVPPAGTWVLVSLHHNRQALRAEMFVQDARTLEVLGSSVAEHPSQSNALIYVRLQDYLRNPAATLVGRNKIKLAALSVSAAWPPYTIDVPEPTSVAVTQTATNTLTLSWASTCQMFILERNVNSAGWTTLSADFDGQTPSYVDSTLSNGQSVQYRVTTKIGVQVSSAVTSNTVVVSN